MITDFKDRIYQIIISKSIALQMHDDKHKLLFNIETYYIIWIIKIYFVNICN